MRDAVTGAMPAWRTAAQAAGRAAVRPSTQARRVMAMVELWAWVEADQSETSAIQTTGPTDSGGSTR